MSTSIPLLARQDTQGAQGVQETQITQQHKELRLFECALGKHYIYLRSDSAGSAGGTLRYLGEFLGVQRFSETQVGFVFEHETFFNDDTLQFYVALCEGDLCAVNTNS